MPERLTITKHSRGYKVEIFIGGDYQKALDVCQSYCDAVKLCVTVDPTMYVYTGGRCAGIRVGLINYARFPSTSMEVWIKALNLARLLKKELDQGSFTLLDLENSYFESDREEDQPK